MSNEHKHGVRAQRENTLVVVVVVVVRRWRTGRKEGEKKKIKTGKKVQMKPILALLFSYTHTHTRTHLLTCAFYNWPGIRSRVRTHTRTRSRLSVCYNVIILRGTNDRPENQTTQCNNIIHVVVCLSLRSKNFRTATRRLQVLGGGGGEVMKKFITCSQTHERKYSDIKV